VLNAWLLPDRRWYGALLWGGIAGILTTPLLGLGVLLFGSVMTAYLRVGTAVSRRCAGLECARYQIPEP